MKRAFTSKTFAAKTMVLINKIIPIVEHYQKMGYRMTLRQLYYQLVARDIIKNKLSEYQKISSILKDARMTGMIDWSAIEDRVRVPKRASQWNSIEDLVDSALWSYRLPRRQDQPVYVELWVEKDAIANILKPICDKYHVTLMVNRGYGSASSLYDAASRFAERSNNKKFSGASSRVLLYLGDHDPSGLDMDRDITERLAEFRCPITFKRIGLTFEQIEEYNPPPNYAKINDPRAEGYISEFGNDCWEVDALTPEVLNQLVDDALREHTDMDLYQAWILREEEEKKQLKSLVKRMKEEADEDDDSDDDEDDSPECAQCGEYLDEDTATEIDGEKYCPECSKELECSDCGTKDYSFNLYHDGNENVRCEDCQEKYEEKEAKKKK